MDALTLIGLEQLAETDGHIMVLQEGIALEIILKTAEVHIGGTAGGKIVITHQYLTVQEPCLVKEHFDSRLSHFPQKAATCPVHKAGITIHRHHHTHIYTALLS